MKKSLLILSLASLFGAVAQAADAPAVATNFSLTTNYKFRGQDQGNNKPALQGGFDYAHSSGFYVGNWNSSIGFTDAGIEMDFYGGFKGELAKGFGYDVGVLQYAYPSLSAANTTELYAALSYSIASVKYSRTVSSKYFGILEGKNTGYWDLSANYEVAKNLTLNAHAGFTQFSGGAKSFGAVNYTDYKLGATYDVGSGFSLGGAVVGATKKDFYGDINKARVILTVTKSM
jgi:uncharacterized protein (TIGR02001 family)